MSRRAGGLLGGTGGLMRVLPTNDEDDQEVAFTRPVSVRLQDIESHRAEYANLIHCNFDRAAFQVVFAQFLQPLILSSEDAKELGGRVFSPRAASDEVDSDASNGERNDRVASTAACKFRGTVSSR